jgi:dTDP-4-amino-4,6-dideoxygalactose transaminase
MREEAMRIKKRSFGAFFFAYMQNLYYLCTIILNYVHNMAQDRKMIYLCLAHMSEEGLEQKYIQEAFDTNWVVPLGPNVNAFEAQLKEFHGGKNEAVALSAGTAAVHLGLLACGVGPGDEVCVQSFTFCASSHPITYLGATPVFIDSEKDTWNMDPELLEQAIEDRIAKTGKKPKAIVPVALYGMPYKCDRIMEIAKKYDIPVVEDAAEGFGSCYKGQMLGTFGRFGVLSFNGNKMITTSGGGALLCQTAEDKEKIMWYATQAREAYPYYQHEEVGYNYRMSNICAGIGRGQMAIANDHISHHKHVQALYEELLANVEGITVHKAPSADYDSNYWLCTIELDPSLRIKGQENAYKEVITSAVGGAAGVIHAVDSATTDCQPNDNVEALRVYMMAAKIEARPVWKPMHKQPVYKNAPAYVNGVSEAIFKVGMCLPAGPYVSDDDVRYIVETIKSAIEK